jgi:caa(3)-type oxidase subunit IV
MHDIAKHDDSKAQYFWVWGALLVLTGVEVWLGYNNQIFHGDSAHMLEVLLITSIIKSALIIGYFMHLKFETPLMRRILVVSVTACFIIMYFFFFPDADRIIHLGVK